jgi:hypothetical protein
MGSLRLICMLAGGGGAGAGAQGGVQASAPGRWLVDLTAPELERHICDA